MGKESIKIIDFEKFYEIDQDPSDFNINYTNIEENDYYSEISRWEFKSLNTWTDCN